MVTQKKKVVAVGGTGPPKLIPPSFSGQTKEFTKEEMLAHDRDFSKQLLFRFDAKQKQQNQVAAALSRDLRSTVVVNLNINYAVHQV